MSYPLSVDWILHIAPGFPAPAKKVCCKKVLPSVVTAKGGHSECAPFCVFALHSYLECTKGRMGYKILQSYLQVVRCLKMWQQFEFGFPTGSNPAPPNLLRSTLTNPVWNTGDRLVIIKCTLQIFQPPFWQF